MPFPGPASYTCPNCQHQLAYGRLAFTVPPIWTTCPSCKEQLVGNAFVQIINLVSGLVLVALALGVVLIFPWISVLEGSPAQVQGYVILASLALVLVFILFAGYFLSPRYGSYALRERYSGEPRMLRRYLLATGIAAMVILAILVFFLDVSPTGITVSVPLAFVPLLLIYPRYASRLGHWVEEFALYPLLLGASVVTAFVIVFVTLAMMNLAKGRPFEEKLSLQPAPQHEQDAHGRVTTLLASLDVESAQDRENALDFLAQNVVSVPEGLSITGEFPRWGTLLAVWESEQSEILELAEEGDQSAAGHKYARLWRVAGNLLSGNSTPVARHFNRVSGPKARELPSARSTSASATHSS